MAIVMIFDFYDDDGTALVRILLKAGANVNPPIGDLPLSVAAQRGNVAAVSLLLDQGASVNPATRRAPLEHALKSDIEDQKLVTAVVRLLVEAGANINVMLHGYHCLVMGDCHNDDDVSDQCQTTLEIAGDYERSIEVFDLLMNRGDPVSNRTISNVIRGRNIELIRFLLDRGIRPPAPPPSMTKEIAKLLLEYEPWNSVQALIYASNTKDKDLIKSVFAAGAPVTPSALRRAIEWIDTDMVMVFLNAVSDNFKQDCYNTTMDMAISCNDLDLIRELRSFKAEFKPNHLLKEAFKRAAPVNNAGLFHVFIDPESWFRPKAVKYLRGVLIEAIKHGSSDVVEVFLHKCPTETLEDGPHLIAAAIKKRNIWLLKNLLRAGAAVNQREHEYSSQGTVHYGLARTVLSEAVHTGDCLIVHELINAGADINAPGLYSNKTALSVAVEKGDIVIKDMLIEAGADASVLLASPSAPKKVIQKHSPVQNMPYHGTNEYEQTLVMATAILASIQSDIKVAQLLLEAGAESMPRLQILMGGQQLKARQNMGAWICCSFFIEVVLILWGATVRSTNVQGLLLQKTVTGLYVAYLIHSLTD